MSDWIDSSTCAPCRTPPTNHSTHHAGTAAPLPTGHQQGERPKRPKRPKRLRGGAERLAAMLLTDDPLKVSHLVGAGDVGQPALTLAALPGAQQAEANLAAVVPAPTATKGAVATRRILSGHTGNARAGAKRGGRARRETHRLGLKRTLPPPVVRRLTCAHTTARTARSELAARRRAWVRCDLAPRTRSAAPPPHRTMGQTWG